MRSVRRGRCFRVVRRPHVQSIVAAGTDADFSFTCVHFEFSMIQIGTVFSAHVIASVRVVEMADALRLPRSLNFFIRALCGQTVTVEVRGDCHITGVLDSVDAKMK